MRGSGRLNRRRFHRRWGSGRLNRRRRFHSRWMSGRFNRCGGWGMLLVVVVVVVTALVRFRRFSRWQSLRQLHPTHNVIKLMCKNSEGAAE